MAQHFKYNTGSGIANTTQKGNIAIATSGTYDWGPTSITGYYPETSAPDNGYIIYYMRPSGEPSVHVAPGASKALFFLQSFGATGTTLTNALAWATAQPNYYVQTGATVTYTVGMSALGGYVVYLYQSGDTGYISGEQHGLVVATSDQSSYATWNNGSNISVSTSTSIASGYDNSRKIVAAQGSGTYAASVARNYTGGGYTDWFLPSTLEFSKVVSNLGLFNFYSRNYWTSSQSDSSNAFMCDTNFNSYSAQPSSVGYNVRAMRYF